MRCPDELELARWADGFLPEERAEAIRLHLAECLECRLSVGTPSEAISATPHTTEPPLPFPPFERIQGRLRAAFDGRAETDLSFRDRLAEDEPLVLMAADTDSRPNVAAIPSYYSEGGKLVVTFRVDAQGKVTAFFVSEKIESIRFRALKVGESWYLSDAEGRTVLSGLSADQVLGKEISVPPVLASAYCQYAEVAAKGIRLNLLPAGGGDSAQVRLGIRVVPQADHPILVLRPEGLASGQGAVIVVADNRDARLLLLSEGEEASTPWQDDAPRALRFDLIDRA
jgi:hypothetical protein